MRKATRQQLKMHNRRLVLRCVYGGEAHSRAALAGITGLAKPTVSDIVSSLIDQGLLTETGPGKSTESGGKRPTLLEFVPEARQVIGVSMTATGIDAVLADMNGQSVLHHRTALDGAEGEDAVIRLMHTINALTAQLDAPLLCLAVGVPGLVDTTAGIVVEFPPPLSWHQLALAARLSKHYGTPVYCANNTELVTRAHLAYDGSASTAGSLVTVLVNHGVEIGMAHGSGIYRHSLDTGALVVGNNSLAAVLGAQAFQQRARSLRVLFRNTLLPEREVMYLDVRDALRQGDRASIQLFEELTDRLAEIYAWIIALIRPDHVTLAGEIVDLGERLIERIRQKVMVRLPADAVEKVTLSLTETAHSRTTGAVAFALQQELGLLA